MKSEDKQQKRVSPRLFFEAFRQAQANQISQSVNSLAGITDEAILEKEIKTLHERIDAQNPLDPASTQKLHDHLDEQLLAMHPTWGEKQVSEVDLHETQTSQKRPGNA